MNFCPLCGSYHKPDVSCVDRAGGILKDAGIERPQMRRKEFKKMLNKIDRTMLIVLYVSGAQDILTVRHILKCPERPID